MRIRGTKPEFWKSRRIASVSWDARLVLKGLESYVDDNGVGVDDIELIVTDIFPRDMFAKGSETAARVSEAISELHQAGLVHRYEARGDRLLYIAFWESIQRIDKPGKGRNPRPDGTFDYKESEIRESVANPPEPLAPVTGEQGNRGTEEQGQKVPAQPPAGAASSDPAHEATVDAYERVGKAFKFVAVLAIAKWAVKERGVRPDALANALVGIYDMGKPITRQTVGQYLDGKLGAPQGKPTTGDKMRDTLARSQALQDRLNNSAPQTILEIGA
jgi:hypothetical protein